MSALTRIARLVRVATLPETRGAARAVARSEGLRVLARRARTDRAGLARDLGNPANARGFVLGAFRHPATRELASAGLLLLPARYLPAGWVATWAARKLIRRFGTDDKPDALAEHRR